MKIELSKKNANEIDASVAEFQGRATAGTVCADDLFKAELLAEAQSALDEVLFRRDQIGAIVEIAIKGVRASKVTHIKIAKGSRKGVWYLVGFRRGKKNTTVALYKDEDNDRKTVARQNFMEQRCARNNKVVKEALRRIEKRKKAEAEAKVKAVFESQSVSISSIESSKKDGYYHLGMYVVYIKEHGTWDNNRYSKAYHRQYGGVWEREKIEVKIYKKSGATIRCTTHLIDSFRGKWLTKLLIGEGIVKENRERSAITLDRLHSARRVKDIELKNLESENKIFLYERYIIKGQIEDYVAVKGGTTYHDKNPRLAIKCLNEKIATKKREQQARGIHRVITREFVSKKMNFCQSGINSFLSKIGFEFPEEIDEIKTVDLIKKIKATKKADLSQFAEEISRLKKVTGLSW